MATPSKKRDEEIENEANADLTTPPKKGKVAEPEEAEEETWEDVEYRRDQRYRRPFKGALERLAEDHFLKLDLGLAEDDSESSTLIRLPATTDEEEEVIYVVKMTKAKLKKRA